MPDRTPILEPLRRTAADAGPYARIKHGEYFEPQPAAEAILTFRREYARRLAMLRAAIERGAGQ